ncbi:MAG: MBL fold metallo-hydrolase [Syntrophales bacterium]|jgi:glyoxylase-like metal-dependent hydrolase (beta-lactamase superfamily II)|nr:MBL fold metallo-hydrolase [Syntrophales bacterium]MDY0044319.1 MBL fold metallo-hydrolase [Syntrophales bacterium]
MGFPEEIISGVYLIGGPNISHSEDAAIFLVDCGSELVMIDSGAGRTAGRLEKTILTLGFNPENISALILTHCHIDHIGGAPYFAERFGCRLVAHDLDAAAIESGDPVETAARMYGTVFPPTPVDHRIKGEEETFTFGTQVFRVLHTPGHTPGSLSVVIERNEKRVLFGQDIHGPFLKAFRSDIGDWKSSMAKLLALEADILCEGHFGIFRSKKQVRTYIEGYLKTRDSGFPSNLT